MPQMSLKNSSKLNIMKSSTFCLTVFLLPVCSIIGCGNFKCSPQLKYFFLISFLPPPSPSNPFPPIVSATPPKSEHYRKLNKPSKTHTLLQTQLVHSFQRQFQKPDRCNLHFHVKEPSIHIPFCHADMSSLAYCHNLLRQT